MRRIGLLFLTLAWACGDAPAPAPSADEPVAGVPGVAAVFDPDADLTRAEEFYDLPWPMDVRLRADGTPDVGAYPGAAEHGVIGPVHRVAGRRQGHPVNPAAIFRFDARVAPQAADATLAISTDAPLLLVDVDPASPERGRLFAVVAETPEPDPFAPEFVLSVSTAPGVVLAPARTYAFVVRRSLGDADGAALGVGEAFARLRAGRIPTGVRGPALAASFAPLWEALDDIGVARDDVAVATVFTTGDVVADALAWMDPLLARTSVSIENVAVEADGGAAHERFCEITATVEMPQLQRGTPPFDREGDFETGADGLPVVQRTESVPVVLTLPRSPMPPAGYPVVLYVHGSGGLARQAVDRGPVLEPGGERQPGLGPAHVLAAHGVATVAPAMPLNPERLPGAASRAYLNFLNLGAYPYTFQQGTFELRLLLDALGTFEIPAATLDDCGPSPTGGGSARLSTARVGLHGQSMGAQYANMLGALDPRVAAVMPTGSGGLWTLVILLATIEDGLDVGTIIGPLLGTEAPVSYLHPALQLVELALEPAETMVFAPRMGHRPLPGHPARHVFQPVGRDDPGFPNAIYDAMALASSNQQAGTPLWSSLQDALALDGLDGILAYPVAANRTSVQGTPRAGVVVQYEADGIVDSHHVFAQRDDLKHQYGCWFASFFRDGTPLLPGPAALGTPCP